MRTLALCLFSLLFFTSFASAQSARDREMSVCDSVEAAKNLVIISRGSRYVAQNVFGKGCEWRIGEYRRGTEAYEFWFEGKFFKIVPAQILRVYDDKPLPQGTKYIILQVTEERIASAQPLLPAHSLGVCLHK